MLPAENAARDFIPVTNIFEVPESDPFTIFNARIENDSLKMLTSFAGGCREHDFSLYVSRVDTVPKTIYLYVWHNANHDLCRTWVEAHPVAFDLRGLKRDLKLKGDASLVSRSGQDDPFSLSY